MDVTRLAIEGFLRFVLTAARVSGLFLVSPALSPSGVPRRVKVGLAVMVALVVFPVLPAASASLDVGAMTLGAFLVGMIGELAIGVTIGLVAAFVMAGLEMAGLFIGQQTGLALANVINPISGTSVSVMGRFYSLFGLVIFLIIGGHRMLVAAILKSFQAVPLAGAWQGQPGAGAAAEPIALRIVSLSGQIFAIAVAVSAPVVLALVLTTLALGLIARTVPQLNILAVGFPVRIWLGWTIVLISLGAVGYLSRDLFFQMFEDLASIIDLM